MNIQRIIDFYHSNEEYWPIKTSGSTGTPKTIRLEKDKILQSAEMTGDFFGLENGDHILINLNVEYIAGFMMVIRALHLGLDYTLVPPSQNPLDRKEAQKNFDQAIWQLETKPDWLFPYSQCPLQIMKERKSRPRLSLEDITRWL